MKFQDAQKLITYINYLLTEPDIKTLFEEAKKVPENGVIVDIGTAEGGSAFMMSFGSKDSVKVYTIDPNESKSFLSHRDDWDLEEKLTYIIKTSEDAIEDVPKEIDLLFIDGIHNYEGVTNDFNWYGERVKKGGIIIFHDYYLYRDTIGKAVDDIIASGRAEKIKIVEGVYKGDKNIGMYVARKT